MCDTLISQVSFTQSRSSAASDVYKRQVRAKFKEIEDKKVEEAAVRKENREKF